jgi:outer membrane protein insertion porin family
VIVDFVVEETPTGEFSIAAGYSSNEGVIGEVAFTERNLLGKGQFLRVKLAGSLENLQADLSFTEPRFMDQDIAAGFDIFHKELDFQDESGFSQRKTGGSLRAGFALTDEIYFQKKYTLLQDEVFDVDDDASPIIIEDNRLISSVGYTISYDTRDNRAKPSRGIFLSADQELAGVGGDVQYLQSVVEARGYYPIYEGITLVGRLIGGYITGWGGQDVAAVDAFFKGGETVRGFASSGIGPRDVITGDAVGGKIFYAGTVEVRFPIPFLPEELGFGGAVFADAGSLYESDFAGTPGTDVQDDDTLRSSVGASLLWDSPVGPLRADFAWVITKADFDEEELFRFGASTKF